MEKEMKKDPFALAAAFAAAALAAFTAALNILLIANKYPKIITSVIPNLFFGIPLIFIVAFIAYTLIVGNKTRCMLAYGALFAYKIIEVIYTIGIDGYGKFLVLSADILVLITIGFVFGMLFESNRLQIRYNPPKIRYIIVALYVACSSLKYLLAYLLTSKSFSYLQITVITMNIVLYALVFLFTVKALVKSIIPSHEH